MTMTNAPTLVTEIPTPWRHAFGQVVAVEYPEDRPRVVDLVLASGHRTAETKTAKYAERTDGVWDLARFVNDQPMCAPCTDAMCERCTLGCGCDHTQETADGRIVYAGPKLHSPECAWCGEPDDAEGEQGRLFLCRDGSWMHKGCDWSEQHGALATYLKGAQQ